MSNNDSTQNPNQSRIELLTELALHTDKMSHVAKLERMLELAEEYENGLASEDEEDLKEDQANYWRSIYNEKDGDYKLGIGMEIHSYDLMFKFLAKASVNGNSKAMVRLGFLYRENLVSQINYWNAIDLIEMFEQIEAGNPKAIYSCGKMHHHGYGVPQDDLKAYNWYKKAADLDYAPAISQLAYFEIYNLETKEDQLNNLYDSAAKLGSYEVRKELIKTYHHLGQWPQEILDIKDPAVMAEIGWFYYNGVLMKQEIVTAWKWFEKAANAGYVGLTNTILNVNRIGIKEEFDEDEDFAFRGNKANKQYYTTFHSPAENYRKAMYWFKKAAATNNIEAIFNVGLLYHNGEKWGGDPSKNECSVYIARKWYTKAASLGHLEAAEMLDKLFTAFLPDKEHLQKETKKRISELEGLISKRKPYSDEDILDAMLELIDLYENGGEGGLKPNKAKAKYWYTKHLIESSAF